MRIVTEPAGVDDFASLRRGAIPFRPSALRRIALPPARYGIDNIVSAFWKLIALYCRERLDGLAHELKERLHRIEGFLASRRS
jgi:hypothetical protein